jgi:hypothetical protein
MAAAPFIRQIKALLRRAKSVFTLTTLQNSRNCLELPIPFGFSPSRHSGPSERSERCEPTKCEINEHLARDGAKPREAGGQKYEESSFFANPSPHAAFMKFHCYFNPSYGFGYAVKCKKTNGTPFFTGVTGGVRDTSLNKSVIPAKAGIPFSFSVNELNPLFGLF